MRPSKGIAAALAAVALVLPLSAANAAPPIWRVKGPHAEITLFGSVHLLSADTAWKTPALMSALSDADQVWFEIPLDAASQQEAGVDALKRGMLPPGKTLSSLLGPATEANLDRLCQKLGLPRANLEHLQPWLAELTLQLLYFQSQGARAELGVEEQLSSAAPPTAKREAFETVDQQIGYFADDPLPDQVASLAETLDELETDPGIFSRLAAAWAKGNVKAIVREAVQPIKRDTPGVYQHLLVDRNRRFAARIEEMLKDSPGKVLVVVGVGHLVGQDGVPALLRHDKIKVEGP